MNILRFPFFGGEEFACTDCGHVAERNVYPSDEVSTSALFLWENHREEAEEKGINFSGFTPCNCEPR
jgi:hypothetical protein